MARKRKASGITADHRKQAPLEQAFWQQQLLKSTQIMLLDNEQQQMRPIYEALKAQGYQARIFYDSDESLAYLAQVEVLVMDADIAHQPKSSKFIKVPTILILTENGQDTVPPWLAARHVFLLRHPANPRDFIDRLNKHLTPHISGLGATPHNVQHLALLFGITQLLNSHLDINDLFERIMSLAPHLAADFAALLIQEGDETMYYRSTQPGCEELTGPVGRRFAQRLLKDGLEGWVLRHNQAAILHNTMTDSRWFRAAYLPEQQYGVAALPITLERVQARGVYLLGHREPGHFSRKDIPLLEAVITQIGLAIENALLFKSQSERSVQLSLINEVSQAATSILNLDVMLATVVQAIQRSFAFYSVAIHLYNPDSQLIELCARATADRRSLGPNSLTTHRPRQGLIGWSVAANKTILANDVTQDPRYIATERQEVRSELCVPITLGVKTIGVLDLQSTQLEAFDKYHVSALETLADQLAIAVENARLYEEINQHLQELKSLNEISQAITSVLDLQNTLTLVTDHTTRLMNVAAASVALRDDQTNEVWFAAAFGEGSEAVIGLRMPLGQGLAGWVADRGEPVIVPNVYEDERFFVEIDKHSGFTTRSILCVPLQTKGRTIGAIEVMNKKSGAFNKEDMALLQALALSAATAIENAQLYEEQTRTINRLAETQSQLVQSAKMAAVGELAAGVAHEINNPLTTILGLTSLLVEESGLEDEESLEDLRMIYDEARRARDIVRGLLGFARTDTPQRQPADLNQIIDSAIMLVYTKSVSQKVELVKELEPLPEMALDVNQIKQVIVNLLNNAVQAMVDTGDEDRPARLTLTTRVVGPAAKEKSGALRGIEARDSQPVVECRISDTGRGILPEHLDKIFDPFFTTKEVGQGTGLGLSISYGIIEKHGGNISVDSRPGQGTTFTLTLPVSGLQSESDSG